MIIEIYNPDGTKERKPVGYAGGMCHVATAPYEKREVPGSMRIVPTDEACQQPTAQWESIQEKQKVK